MAGDRVEKRGDHRRHGLLRRLASIAPSAGLRRFLLTRIPGITLAPGAGVGFGTLVAIDALVLGPGTQLGRFNRLQGPFVFHAGAGCRIGARNRFVCGDWVLDPQFASDGYAREIRFGEGCLVTDGHHFDVAGRIDVGDGVWFAGEGSQVWTHGVGVQDRDVAIGARAYLGSAIRIAPGARLGPGSVLAMGAVLSADLSGEADTLIGGVPARVVKRLDADYASGRLTRPGAFA